LRFRFWNKLRKSGHRFLFSYGGQFRFDTWSRRVSVAR
jgi:hypothetical protein